MKRMMSIAAIALFAAGSTAFACDGCGCKAKKDDKAKTECKTTKDAKACDSKKAEAKKSSCSSCTKTKA